jgi:uncharacterized protein (DUF1778 family)
VYASVTYIHSNPELSMPILSDNTIGIDGRATERMNFRTRPHVKRAIQQAAALSGVDDSVFTMTAAYASALATIAAHERTSLDPVDHAAFFAALDNPPQPSASLRSAFAEHRTRVGAK